MDKATSESDQSHFGVDNKECKNAPGPVKSSKTIPGNKKWMKRSTPFTFSMNVDGLQCLLTLISMATRIWRLNYPRAAVFDEVHFGKSASMYLVRTFHFDIYPPLGKMLVALAAHYAGFDGAFKFDKIGAEFGPETPVWHMRLVPALLGSLIAPVAYQIMIEMRFSYWTAALAASLVILDNALLVQSRFILMEGILIFFMALAVLAFLKAKNVYSRDQDLTQWWAWMMAVSVFGTFAISVRYIGLSTMFILFMLSAIDFWNNISLPSVTNAMVARHLIAILTIFFILPIVIYVSVFYVHLSVLTKAGPHDNVLTSAFQASLEGGLAAITKGQPLQIVYGSQITLRHTHGTPCWLHSHNHLYPLRYDDRRGSSHQQQVTCYQFKDVNNWWIIKDPKSQSLVVEEPKRPVRDGDLFQLIHGMSGRSLNSHDVAAPVSPQHQEVAGYIDHNVSHAAQNLWRLEIINKDSQRDYWTTIQSQIRLYHINSSQALKVSGRQLPDWGFHQLEVVTDRDTRQEATIWNVEEHRYSKNNDEDKTKRDLEQAEMIPLKPTHMGFFAKFLELQMKMITSNADSQLEHQYSSDPLEWPLLNSNVAYWIRPNDYAQIHLIGNPVIWYSGVLATLLYVAVLIVLLLRRQRQHYDIPDEQWEHFVNYSGMFLAGYVLNYLPYILMERTMFLYLYLPSLFYQILLLSALVEHLYHFLRWRSVQNTYIMLVIVWFTAVVNTFLTFSTISYGFTALSNEDLDNLAWQDTWSFLKKMK